MAASWSCSSGRWRRSSGSGRRSHPRARSDPIHRPPPRRAQGIRRGRAAQAPRSASVGKRRGGNKLALKTGIVAKKQKTEDEVLTSKGDAWAKYMAEVKKYKAHQCGDDDKTRPLVK
ncbi:Telomerase RNA component interacting RNase [Apodemus speciosus]|uniref:Telomerase RNA component interacting RNase n=1 Tax=Apodemus speciosus TaxID=105296 RepID=A0ABQ0F2A3_APOSI